MRNSKPAMAADDLLTTTEVAELLWVPESRVREWVAAGKLPAVPFLVVFTRFRRGDVEAFSRRLQRGQGVGTFVRAVSFQAAVKIGTALAVGLIVLALNVSGVNLAPFFAIDNAALDGAFHFAVGSLGAMAVQALAGLFQGPA